MRSKVSLFLLAAIVLVSLVVPGARAQDAGEDIAQYRVPENLARLVEDGGREYIIVDVRTPGEYRSGHIPGAVNIDYREIAARPPEVEKDTLVVTYCRSGARASHAQATLERLGYENVVNFGAVSSWPEQLVTGDEPR